MARVGVKSTARGPVRSSITRNQDKRLNTAKELPGQTGEWSFPFPFSVTRWVNLHITMPSPLKRIPYPTKSGTFTSFTNETGCIINAITLQKKCNSSNFTSRATIIIKKTVKKLKQRITVTPSWDKLGIFTLIPT